jgi:hypothetical protein
MFFTVVSEIAHRNWKDFSGIVSWTVITLLALNCFVLFRSRISLDKREGLSVWERLTLMYYFCVSQLLTLVAVGLSALVWQILPVPGFVSVSARLLLIVASVITFAFPVSVVLMHTSELRRIIELTNLIKR